MLSPLQAGRGKPPESGVAAYTGALATQIASRTDLTILGQIGCSPDAAGRATVLPTWTPDMRLAKQVNRTSRQLDVDLIHVQHEFNLYGGLLQGGLLTLRLMAMRRRGIRVVTTVHGVVPPSEVTPAFVRRNSLPNSVRLVRLGFRTAYRAISASSDALVVHHEYFRKVLVESYGVPAPKVHVIKPGLPVMISSRGGGTRREVLTLGFLTGYKLPELLVEVAESDLEPDTIFRFCVGLNPRIKDAAYVDRYKRLEERVRALEARAIWSGYIADDQLNDAFQSAAMLILPYTECVSASAVAALAQHFSVPICYSRPLRPLFGPGTLEFELEAASLARAMHEARTGSHTETSNELFTSWETSAGDTVDLWNGLLESNAHRRRHS